MVQTILLRAKCRDCGWTARYNFEALRELLHSLGMLRRNPDAGAAEMVELAASAAPRMRCPDCSSVGSIGVQPVAEDEDSWQDSVACEICGQPIPAERIEVFPDTTMCVACQRAQESSAEVEHAYCKRCGGPMMLKPSKGPGITRNVMVCADPDCRKSSRRRRDDDE